MSKIEFDVYKTEAATANDYMKSFDTFEAAEEYANENECELIEECGGSWETFKKCWFCGEWYPLGELDRDGLCDRCETAARDHGFDPDTRPYDPEKTEDQKPAFNSPFIDDSAKMLDFLYLSKDEFLESYSYLTEEEYNATVDAVLKLIYPND